MRDKPIDRLPELKKNIGKSCKVIESSVAGLCSKISVIEDVSGNDIDGYRYKIRVPEPLFSWQTKTDYYPPVFLCELL